MVNWRVFGRLEIPQLAIAVVVAISAALMVVGGVACKSSRSAGSMGWVDGVKPWAIWAFLGGFAVLALIGAGWWTDRWLVSALPAIYLFWRAGTEPAAYRDKLEASIVNHPLYTEQELAMGLYLVPVVAIIGAVSSVLLVVVSAAIEVNRRRASWTLSAQR